MKTFTTISQIVELNNKLNDMSTQELWTLADQLEITNYSPDRDCVLATIDEELHCIAWSINLVTKEQAR